MIEKIRYAVGAGNIVWQKHALERMLERGISRKGVKNSLLSGEIIEALNHIQVSLFAIRTMLM